MKVLPVPLVCLFRVHGMEARLRQLEVAPEVSGAGSVDARSHVSGLTGVQGSTLFVIRSAVTVAQEWFPGRADEVVLWS